MILALKSVIDIPESEVMSLLHASAAVSRQTAADENAMQVDAPGNSSIPTLPTVLALCVTYSMSAPALRLAIRQKVPDAAELTAILQVLKEWIDAWCAEDVQLLPQRTKKDSHGALIAAVDEKQKGSMPPLEKVCAQLCLK